MRPAGTSASARRRMLATKAQAGDRAACRDLIREADIETITNLVARMPDQVTREQFDLLADCLEDVASERRLKSQLEQAITEV